MDGEAACDWARTGCSGLHWPEPGHPSLRAAPYAHLLGRAAGLSGPWAATLGGVFPSVRRVLYIMPSVLQAVPYSVLRWLSMLPARASFLLRAISLLVRGAHLGCVLLFFQGRAVPAGLAVVRRLDVSRGSRRRAAFH